MTRLGVMSLADLMGGATAEDEERQRRSPAMATEILRENLGRLSATELPSWCTVGAMVTPRSDSPLKNHGDPHMVVALRPDADHHFAMENNGSVHYGARLDVRVAYVTSDGTIVTWWMESAYLEPWSPSARPDGTIVD